MTNKNPGYQIYFYMQHAGTEWGILTNGILWRFYHKETAHKPNRFYEVDLNELATGGWGDLDDHDRRENERSLSQGWSFLSRRGACWGHHRGGRVRHHRPPSALLFAGRFVEPRPVGA